MTSHSKIDFDLSDAVHSIAKHLNVNDKQVEAAIQLLEAGNTIPFIARYRKELTRGLDEIQLRSIEDAIEKARDLFARKTTILKTIDEQGHLTQALRQQIVECQDMQMLEAIGI
jgi:uncharacterized protein